MKSIELFIFDWSGVISDDRKPVYLANMRLLRDFNKPEMSFETWLVQTAMTPVDFLNNQGIFEDSTELFLRYQKYLNEFIEQGIRATLYSKVFQTLRFLKKQKKKLMILSSHPEQILLKEAKQYQVFDFFDFILGNVKNKAQELEKFKKKHQLSCSKILYIGDTIYDIQSAKKAKITSAGICTGYHTKERLKKENPDFLLNHLGDFKKFLNN